ncbi:uncharacterized protein LOC106642451 [Copidosoma floridanum]|uniref:uncharacterized protein LOC106642451 n=1 Tax=Copidosoma floridanum TaxID=29053 RepID=UPI0006C956FA|nr:uncharacterized protein LOC106642451 [Copidosoma floridanum]
MQPKKNDSTAVASKMCARLLACPLCSQPGFLTLDALRAGLVSVATRPLACPVCNEVLLGIDKLTIHLFSHAMSNPSATETAAKLIQVRSAQAWNSALLGTTMAADGNNENAAVRHPDDPGTSGIYIPIDDIDNFRNLTSIATKDASVVVPASNGQGHGNGMKAPGQVIFLQNVTAAQPKILGVINQADPHDQLPPGIYQTIATTDAPEVEDRDDGGPIQANVVITVNGMIDKAGKESFIQASWPEGPKRSEYPPSHTDRLADLVKNSQIAASPLGTYHESFDCSKPESSPPMSPRSRDEPPRPKPQVKSTQILTAAERTERCDVCGFSFPDRTILTLHKQLVHMIRAKDAKTTPETATKNYPCHLCAKVFKMRGSLMVHMRVAHPNISAAIRRELNAQQQESGGNEQDSEAPDIEGGYNCPICGKNFKKEQHVAQHLKVHDGKQYECDECSKQFTTKYFLKKHKRLHSGEMPYKCTICDKTFTFQQSFYKHRMYHKDEKPHSCITCGRSFKELSTLHNHERIHTGEKPFACETCGKSFRQRVSYLVHQRIHTGAMPYKCAACDKNFRYKVSQRTHKCNQQPADTVVQQPGVFSQNPLVTSETSETSMERGQDMEVSEISKESQYVVAGGNEDQPEMIRKDGHSNDESVNKSDSNDTNDFIQRIWSQDSTAVMEYKNSEPKSVEVINIEKDKKEKSVWKETTDCRNNASILEDSISKHFAVKEVNNEFTNNLWNDSSANEVNYEKLPNNDQLNNTNDFFSMVMSPLENGVSSPSTEMEHLRLSSPVNSQENATSDVTDCFSTLENSSPSAVQVDCNDIQRNFSDNNSNLSTLQTINDDSLKELLYGIDNK